MRPIDPLSLILPAVFLVAYIGLFFLVGPEQTLLFLAAHLAVTLIRFLIARRQSAIMSWEESFSRSSDTLPDFGRIQPDKRAHVVMITRGPWAGRYGELSPGEDPDTVALEVFPSTPSRRPMSDLFGTTEPDHLSEDLAYDRMSELFSEWSIRSLRPGAYAEEVSRQFA